jgi:hypothetical protein
MAACGIAPEDDDGNAATKKKPAIDNNRLSQAIQKIKEGAYTTDKLRDTFALTAEQEKVLVGALANE